MLLREALLAPLELMLMYENERSFAVTIDDEMHMAMPGDSVLHEELLAEVKVLALDQRERGWVCHWHRVPASLLSLWHPLLS